MRSSRIFLRAEGTHFHVVSRIVGREFLLGEREKEFLHKLMRRLEKASGIQVLTYCWMDNHVHLLLRTPGVGVGAEMDAGADGSSSASTDGKLSGESMSDAELLRRVAGLYSKAAARELEWQLKHWRGQKNTNMVRFWREKYLARLGNLSEFMWALKNFFTRWYNKENGRTGTLWEGRYKLVVVQGEPAVLAIVAAYIDLNPVRAGITDDPGTYHWSGYGEAVAGGAAARRGITRVTGSSANRGWRDAGPNYRVWLFLEGQADAPGTKVEVRRNRFGKEIGRRGVISREKVAGVLEKRGVMGLGELVRHRVRYLTAGTVIGTRAFVDKIFKAQSGEVRGERKTGARKMRGGDWGEGGLYSMRDLRKDVIGGEDV